MPLFSTVLVTLAIAASSSFAAAPPHLHRNQDSSSTFPTPTLTAKDSCTRPTPDLTNCSPNQCPHQYTFKDFAPGYCRDGDAESSAGQSNEQPYFRFLILFKLNKDLCEEQAHEHWKTVHADLTLASKDTGVDILRYVQFHADTAHRDAIKSLVDTGSVEVAPYDGIAEFHAKDAASILRFINHAFGNPTIVKDQEYFVDTDMKLQVMAGYDTLIFGSGIKTSNGTDGIMPGDSRFNDS